MSREAVVRAGTGPLHIRSGGATEAICGKQLPAKVTTWPRGKLSAAVWNEWRRCRSCESLHNLLVK